ncbi:hypothetical protein [Catalinimonas niigatensis]|uniref:hypothetical protein n=1 Tax=Catalinimonas niigatensis TaxID=1397264 RepID=UPI0026667FE2|nr:hypothetical protein [Catalinimonas niigatensis]WPP51803.1 hypothetical protein PZB72_05305 [Catalinimonas niigatensis]
MQDDYPPVGLTASAISYDVFKNKDAEKNLKQYIRHENKDLALMVINHLLYVQHQQPFVEDIKQIYQNQEVSYEVSAASKDLLGRLGIIPNNFVFR